MSKTFKALAEINPRQKKELEALEIDTDEVDLYIDTRGEIHVYIDNEGHYHPDDPSAIKDYYLPTGVTV